MVQINLNHLTTWEYLNFKGSFRDYKEVIICFLHAKRLVASEKDILASERSASMADIMPVYPERFINLGRGQWLDIWANVPIVSTDPFFDTLFAYRVRQLDLLQIGQFLQCALDAGLTQRFISLLLLKHGSLLTPLQLQAVNLWSECIKQPEYKVPSGFPVIKGRPKRQKGDRLTCLSQEQTTLLIHYLQKTQITFSGDYLNNNKAAQAFELLTGYSAEKIRKSLTQEQLQEISDKNNLTALYNSIIKLSIQVNQDITNKSIK
ncbi:MAG TPA: hypothetical protein VD905_19575 [Flavobacteriales bacterium]|nr:hypothetical protein [Flavobacteriales bacterium]